MHGWSLACHKCNFLTRIVDSTFSVRDPTGIDIIDAVNWRLKLDSVGVVWYDIFVSKNVS